MMLEPGAAPGSRGRGFNANADIQYLGAQELARIDAALSQFLNETQIRCAVLLDRTGRLLTTAGDVEGLDGTSFASLAAADFAASDQLAELLGEEEFSSLYHAGESNSMYLAGVGQAAVLAAMFDGRTTLGMVRLRAKTLLPQLEQLFQQMATQDRAKKPDLDQDWLADAVGEVDRLFNG